MCMGQHQTTDRLLAQVLLCKRHSRRCGLARGERIDHDPAGLAFDERDVGNIKAAQLVHTVHHLVETYVGIELRMAPQAGVDGIGGCALQKIIGRKVTQDAAVGGQYLARRPCDQATLGVFKILPRSLGNSLHKSCIFFLRAGTGIAAGTAYTLVFTAGHQAHCQGNQPGTLTHHPHTHAPGWNKPPLHTARRQMGHGNQALRWP